MIPPALLLLTAALASAASGGGQINKVGSAQPRTSTAADACPPFGAARCPAQGECGAHAAHNLAYSLRVGHLDYDPVSRKLYNPGTAGEDFKKWEYFDAPPFENRAAWCLEECGAQEPGAACVQRLKKTGPPAQRPPHPRVVRCFAGEAGGGIDWNKHLRCGAPKSGQGNFMPPASVLALLAATRPSQTAGAGASTGGGMTADQLRNCTGGNPSCICVKGVAAYDRYESAAARAIGAAFPGQTAVPAGMDHADATAQICDAYNASPFLGAGSECRAQADEIVFEDPRAPNPAYPTISVDVVTSAGAFWRNAIAACAPGVQ